ncbi:hypothetical protein DRP04_05580, partial [Archaeoglobales archaeon]
MTEGETQEENKPTPPLVKCSRCGKEVQPDISKIRATPTGANMLCPNCHNWAALKKSEVQKLIDYYGELPKPEKEEEDLEEEFDPREVVKKIISEIDSRSLSPTIKEEILNHIDYVPPELINPGWLYDLLRNRLQVNEKVARLAYNRYVMALETWRMKSERAKALLDAIAPLCYDPYGFQQQNQPSFWNPFIPSNPNP